MSDFGGTDFTLWEWEFDVSHHKTEEKRIHKRSKNEKQNGLS
jgi:hypothetical protein